jgi:hypothetical protein
MSEAYLEELHFSSKQGNVKLEWSSILEIPSFIFKELLEGYENSF